MPRTDASERFLPWLRLGVEVDDVEYEGEVYDCVVIGGAHWVGAMVVTGGSCWAWFANFRRLGELI